MSRTPAFTAVTPIARPLPNAPAKCRNPHSRTAPPRKRTHPPPSMCIAHPPTNDSLTILTYPTTPIPNQNTGTSGLRRKTRLLLSTPHYLPNWLQALFTTLGPDLHGATLVLGGDGRFHNAAAAQTVLRLAAANGVARVVVGRHALLTTPAVSALVPARRALGALIMTASHNPAGIDADWGVKYNTKSGAPAQNALTDRVYEETCKISSYKLADLGGDVDLSSEGVTTYAGGQFTVEVIHPVTEYAAMLQSIFDFPALRELLGRPDFSLCFDAMHASTGPYARLILEGLLGAEEGSVINGVPLEDFGGGHPDPNLTYAAELVAILDPNKNPSAPQFGAASDGDGDRNMILGRGVFVSPGDSVAIIADYAERSMPYFARGGLKGLARSMPTSSALDRVAAAKGLQLYETPTGWKYFTSLMDADRISICGEESFGTSSDHIREKDGLWAVLAWLSILACRNRDTPIGQLVTVENILIEHWGLYGRTYSMRYDFESVTSEAGDAVMARLRAIIDGSLPMPADVGSIDEFEYMDPINGSVASQQGVRMVAKGGGRAVYRLSGTGSAGATIRIYFEMYEEPSPHFLVQDPRVVFEGLVETAMHLAQIAELTGCSIPTVIT